jgi:hypothetical protein
MSSFLVTHFKLGKAVSKMLVKLTPGKTLNLASGGANPLIFSSFDRKVFYREDGLPLGSNSEIAVTLGKVFGFDVKVPMFIGVDSYDPKTGNWSGGIGGVSSSFFS